MLTVFVYVRYWGWRHVSMAKDYKVYRIDRQCLKKKDWLMQLFAAYHHHKPTYYDINSLKCPIRSYQLDKTQNFRCNCTCQL
jgi:hypothetical protein